MCKIIYLIAMLSVIMFCSGKRRKKDVRNESLTEWSDHLKFYSNITIDVNLYETTTWIQQEGMDHNTTSFTGVIEVRIPPDSQFLCFPDSSAEFHQAYLLAHITCRKLGFMTLSSVSGAEFLPLSRATKNRGIKLDSNTCFNQEQIVSRCRWDAVSIKSCQNVTKVTCGGCQREAKGFSGVIESPGFPYVNLYDVTCEWTVTVPVKNSIYLTFNNFHELLDDSVILPCSVFQPYIEIIYGIQSKVTVHRFCRSEEVTNISIPFHTVKILIFTGFPTSQELSILKQKKGFSVMFKAIPEEEGISSPLKMVLLSLLGLIFVTCTITCRYIQKHKMCDYGLQKDAKPDEEVDRVQDFRCDNNLTEKDNQNERKKSVTEEFNLNTSMLNKGSHQKQDSPKFFTQIPMQIFSDRKQTQRKEWPAKTRAMQRYSAREDPNRLCVTSPLLQDSVYKNVPNSKETVTQEQRFVQTRDETATEPLYSVISSFFN